MTTAGSISLGVEIDASDFKGELTREVIAAMGPVLAEMNAGLAGVGAAYDDVADDAERSANRQVRANRKVVRSAAMTAAAIRAARREAGMGGNGPTLSRDGGNFIVNHVTNNYRTTNNSTTRNTTNVRNSTGSTGAAGGGTGGGGGGGGSPGGPGINAGGFMRGGKGRYGFLTSPVGMNMVALAVGSFPAAATATMELVGAIQQLSQAGLVLPGVLAGFASSALTAKLGFMGLSDGVTAFWEAAKSGDPKDLEKAEEAIKELAPAVQDVARLVGRDLRPEFIRLQQLVGQNMFDGIAGEITTLTSRTMPTLEKGLGGISSAWNETFKEIARVGGSDSTLGIMDRIFGNTAEGQRRANAAIDPLVKGLGTLAAAGTDTLPRLGDALTAVSTRFSDFITKADGDGRLAKWIDQGITGVGDLGETFLNLGKMITALTGASGTDDGGFLKWLRESTTQLQLFMNSAEGQETLKNFFAEGREQLSQWGDLLRDLMPILRDVYNGMQAWADVLLPVLSTIVSLVGALPGGLESLVVAFLAFKTLSPFTGILSQLGQVNTAIGTKGGKGGKGGTGLLGNLAAIGGGALLFDGFQDQQENGVGIGNTAQNIAGGALAGAGIAGVPGAIAGAIGGIATSIYNKVAGELDKERAEFENKWTEQNTGEEGQRRYDESVAKLPSMQGPTATQDLRKMFETGNVPPGYTLGPDGQIFGPGGVPLNLPKLPALPIAPPPAPPPPAPAPPKPLFGPQVQQQPVVVAPPPTAPLIGGAGTAKIEVDPNAQLTVDKLASSIENLPTGEVKITDATPEVIKNLEDVDAKITKVSENEIVVEADTTSAKNALDKLIRDFNGRKIQLQLGVPAALPAVGGAGAPPVPRALGGPIWGGVPGKDSVPVLAMPGEHMLTVSDVNAMGGHGGVMAFRRALHGAPGFADGGAIAGFNDVRSQISGTGDDNSEIGLLRQIRDLLAGNGGGPLSETASATSALAGDVTKTKRDPGREMMEAAIEALGGDPDKFLPPEVAERVSRETLAGLTPAMQGFADVTGKLPGDLAAATDLSPMRGDAMAQAVVSLAKQADGGEYVWGGSDLAEGLSDCSGAVSDLVELMTKGSAGPERLFSTADAASVLKSLGAVEGAVPGALQIGWDEGHMRSTLPNGVAFESGGGTGQGATYGGNARGAAGMPNIMSLPTGLAGLLPGGETGALDAMGNPLGYSGSPVPVYIVNGPGGGMGQFGQQMLGGALDGATSALQNVVDPLARAALDVNGRPIPENVASTDQLLRERNPFALASLGGIQVGDYSRQGGDGGPIMANQTKFTADGDLLSDTGALSDRTATSEAAAADARHQQLLDVLTQTRDQLSEEALMPVLQTAVTEGMNSVKEAVSRAQGEGMGTTAAPIIADAVGQAVKSNMPPPGAAAPAGGAAPVGAAGQLAGMLFAEGGPVYGGKPGVDSVPALLMPNEHVFTTRDVAAMGGHAGVYQFRRALHAGKVRGFATGGGVVVNDTVGAEFFGVSQVPILGMIVNIIVKLLLAIIGVEIEARDTLAEMTDEFRGFRGDFQTFDATGRLFSDTSALTERSETSEETAAAERIRILKIVIEALIKFIIEKIIAPIVKAVANSAIQAGAAAAGAAVNSQAPGAGGIVSSLISSAGTAAVEVGTEFWSTAAVQATPIIIDVISELLGGLFPNLLKDIFSGNWITDLFKPVGDILGNGIGGLLGGFAALFGGLGGAATDVGMFDSGGIAAGVGLMPKATIAPERVLSPRQTQNHERLTAVLESGALDALKGPRTGDITIIVDNERAAEEIGNHLAGLLT